MGEACRKIGWTKKPIEIHRYLCSDPNGVGTIKQRDLEWLGLEHVPENMGIVDLMTLSSTRGRDGHGPASKDAFLKQLKHRYGNLPRAWRLVLDLDGSGSITYNEFAMACRNVGFEGSLKKLWQQFDDDGSGVISLFEVDPEAATLMHSFKHLLTKNHDTAEAAWKTLDPMKKRGLNFKDFSQRAKALGLRASTTDLKNIFAYLTKDFGTGKVNIHDIEWLGIMNLGVEDGS